MSAVNGKNIEDADSIIFQNTKYLARLDIRQSS